MLSARSASYARIRSLVLIDYAGTNGISSRGRRQQENLPQPAKESRSSSTSRALKDVRTRLNSFMRAQTQKESFPSRSEDECRRLGGHWQETGSLCSSTDQEEAPGRLASSQPDLPNRKGGSMSESGSGLDSSGPFNMQRVAKGENEAGRLGLLGRTTRERGWEDVADAKDGLTVASLDIADIDSRLQSLQEFLRAARANSGATVK